MAAPVFRTQVISDTPTNIDTALKAISAAGLIHAVTITPLKGTVATPGAGGAWVVAVVSDTANGAGTQTVVTALGNTVAATTSQLDTATQTATTSIDVFEVEALDDDYALGVTVFI